MRGSVPFEDVNVKSDYMPGFISNDVGLPKPSYPTPKISEEELFILCRRRMIASIPVSIVSDIGKRNRVVGKTTLGSLNSLVLYHVYAESRGEAIIFDGDFGIHKTDVLRALEDNVRYLKGLKVYAQPVSSGKLKVPHNLACLEHPRYWNRSEFQTVFHAKKRPLE